MRPSLTQLHHPWLDSLSSCLKRKKGHTKIGGPFQKQQKDFQIPPLLPNRTWKAETGSDEVSVIWLWQPNPSSFHPLNKFCFEEEKHQTFDLLDRSRGKERLKIESLSILVCSSVHDPLTDGYPGSKVEIKGNLSEQRKIWSNCVTNRGAKKPVFLSVWHKTN